MNLRNRSAVHLCRKAIFPAYMTVPNITLYLFVATAGRRAILAQSGHQFQTTPQAPTDGLQRGMRLCQRERFSDPRALWEDFIVIRGASLARIKQRPNENLIFKERKNTFPV